MTFQMERITFNGLLGEFMLGEFVFNIDSLYAYLRQLTDQRDPRGVRYGLADALLLIILSKLSGEDEVHGISEWLRLRAEELVCLLQLPRTTMPHEVTLSRIMGSAVETEELEAVMQKYFDGQAQLSQEVVIAIDGKTMRGTIPKGETQGVHLLAAYLPSEGLVLMQVEVQNKENEIVAAPKLLKSLDLRQKVVIGDAMHTQRQLSIQIVEAGGDYLWVAKDNQATLKGDIEHLFSPQQCPPATSPLPTDFQSVTDTHYGHGRFETRTLTSSSMLKDFLDWPHLEQVFKLEYEAIDLQTGQLHNETHYGLTSLATTAADPQRLLALKRHYWGIENRLHYRRDVCLNEDRCRLRTGHAAHTMAIINNLVLAMIDKLDFKSVPDARRYFAAHPFEPLTLFFQSPISTLQ